LRNKCTLVLRSKSVHNLLKKIIFNILIILIKALILLIVVVYKAVISI